MTGIISTSLKRFSKGIGASFILSPLSASITQIAQAMKLIQATSTHETIQFSVDRFQKRLSQFGIIGKFNVDNIEMASCPLEEAVTQYNSHFSGAYGDGFRITALGTQLNSFHSDVLIAPLWEELLFRGFIQDVLLTRIPKYIIKKNIPGKEAIIDSSISKIARITLSAALFSVAHMNNKGAMPDAYVYAQMANAFILGIGLGVVKESNAGLLGSIGAHMSHNFAVTAVQVLMNC
ncbi:MAG: CPBP family intramembrane metalloprotease [Parachlamydiaceae bacterium]|nr:CPBP family intramembrane metalloprotease [Parachlamydiaceae bacterium]